MALELILQKIKNGLKKRKVKVFLVFLFCSALIWFINNLSRSYTGDAVFDLNFMNVPDGYLYESASKNKVGVKLKAGGFQFLRFNFMNKRVNIDLSQLSKNDSSFFAPVASYRQQIESQLPRSMVLLEMDEDTLFFEMLPVMSKKVPVKPKVVINLAQNYLMEGGIKVTPDSILLTGPKKEIDTIDWVRTKGIRLPDLDADFSRDVDIVRPEKLEHTTFSENGVNLKAKIARFSEKVFKVPITTVNFPAGAEIKTFPEMASVLCKAKIKRLQELEESDFQVVGDYESIKDPSSKELKLSLVKQPEGLHSTTLLEDEVEYVIKKE
ncbi:CdaR family protein [Pareuzebyella sediminis]|uniref:CdaR family protein n=1 Tax=Pareuzebyella sediminis TaxID=2607998 RepID=UPI0011EBC296|nr:CdaR family protein [Pareuzebyella sediminis]